MVEKGVPISSRVRSRASSAVVDGKGRGRTSGGIADIASATGVELTLSTTSLSGSLETITACLNTRPSSAKERPARLCWDAKRCSGSSVTEQGRTLPRRLAPPRAALREVEALRLGEPHPDEENPLEAADGLESADWAGEPRPGSGSGSEAGTALDASLRGWEAAPRCRLSAGAGEGSAPPLATAGAPVAAARRRLEAAPSLPGLPHRLGARGWPGVPHPGSELRSFSPEILGRRPGWRHAGGPGPGTRLPAPAGFWCGRVGGRGCSDGLHARRCPFPVTQPRGCPSRGLASEPDLAQPGPGPHLRSRRPGGPPEELLVRRSPSAAGRGGCAGHGAGPYSSRCPWRWSESPRASAPASRSSLAARRR